MRCHGPILLGLLGLAVCCGCAATDDGSPPPAAKTAPAKVKKGRRAKPAPAVAEPTPVAAPPPPASAEPAAPVCPEGMALVEGDHCRAVEQRCLEQLSAADGGADENRCAKFEASKCTSTAPEPARCVSAWIATNTPGRSAKSR